MYKLKIFLSHTCKLIGESVVRCETCTYKNTNNCKYNHFYTDSRSFYTFNIGEFTDNKTYGDKISVMNKALEYAKENNLELYDEYSQYDIRPNGKATYKDSLKLWRE